MNKRELERAIEREVESWPGVSVQFVDGGKHPKAKLKFGDLVMSRPYASTPSDGVFGLHACLGDMRKVMKQLGAVRDKPEPSKEEDEAPYRKPNDGAAKRQNPPRERAAVQPDVADQLEAKGFVTAEQIAAARALSEKALGVQATLLEREPERQTIVVPDEGETVEEAAAEARREELAELVASIADGIYFGLDDVIYHAVPALGGSSICNLLVSPANFWCGSWLDPNRPELDEEATAAQIIGRAYHCARLEPDQFEVRFCKELAKSDMPKGSLFGGTDMGKALEERGLKKSGSVAEQAERLADDGFPVEKLWHLALINWKRELGTRQPIPAKVWDEITIDMERIRSVPEIAALLTGGAAEVSVIWTDENGLRCKARFDYLKPDSWADLKTYQNSNRKRLEQAIADAIRYNRYYVIAAHYRDAAEAIRTKSLPIRGPATDAQRELIAKIQIAPRALECWFVFQEKGGVPNLLARRFRFSALDTQREYEIRAMLGENPEPAKRQMIEDSLAQTTGIYKLAQMEMRKAKADFQLYNEVYQPGEPWAPIDPIGSIDDADFPPRFLEGMY